MPANQNEIGLATGGLPPGFKPKGTAAELKALEMECAFLNNPEISGGKAAPGTKVVPADSVPTLTVPPAAGTAASIPVDKPHGAPASLSPAPVSPEGPQDSRGATLAPTDPALENVPAAPAPQPIPAAPAPTVVPPPEKILLTGRTGVGKSFLASRSGALVLELDDVVRNLAKIVLGNIADGPQADALVDTIMQWGNGQVNQQYPLTPARLLFCASRLGALTNLPEDYGTPGCWVRNLIERALNLNHDSGQQVIVTGVTSVDDFKALIAAGFRHYHVVCSAASYTARPKRKNANDQLAAALDKDITQKLSGQRQGEKLRCIWSDGGVPHPRLFSVDQWLQAIAITNAPLGEVAFE